MLLNVCGHPRVPSCRRKRLQALQSLSVSSILPELTFVPNTLCTTHFYPLDLRFYRIGPRDCRLCKPVRLDRDAWLILSHPSYGSGDVCPISRLNQSFTYHAFRISSLPHCLSLCVCQRFELAIYRNLPCYFLALCDSLHNFNNLH